MKEYLDLVKHALQNGIYKKSRTGVDTLADFAYSYQLNLADGFPLLTTKNMMGKRWNSNIREIIWYLSGEHHVRELSKETKIWDAWKDPEGNLETAYGRYWRRWPIHGQRLEGEALVGEFGTNNKGLEKYITVWGDEQSEHRTFDQLAAVRDLMLNDPDSRRMIVVAWNPANAFASKLPPCHYTFAFNVIEDRLNVVLVQRSGDIGLGIPFNVAAYSLLNQAMAMQTEILPAKKVLKPGIFAHTIFDAHIYCGREERGRFYEKNRSEFQRYVAKAETPDDFLRIIQWIEANAPDDFKKLDHIPGLLLQLTREPKKKPALTINKKPLDELAAEDFQVIGYDSHPGISFGVAE